MFDLITGKVRHLPSHAGLPIFMSTTAQALAVTAILVLPALIVGISGICSATKSAGNTKIAVTASASLQGRSTWTKAYLAESRAVSPVASLVVSWAGCLNHRRLPRHLRRRLRFASAARSSRPRSSIA